MRDEARVCVTTASPMRGRALGRAAFILLLAFVTVLSVASFPSNAPPGNAVTRMIAAFLLGDAAHADKVGHFLAYFVLGGAAYIAGVARRPVWLAPALLALYGAGLEGVQYFLANRTADIVDAAVNGFGAALGFALVAGLSGLVFPQNK